jgi:hypothetical protein
MKAKFIEKVPPLDMTDAERYLAMEEWAKSSDIKNQEGERGWDFAKVFIQNSYDAHVLLERGEPITVSFLEGFASYFSSWRYTNHTKELLSKAGKESGRKRALAIGKNDVFALWKAWRDDPNHAPYGNKTGAIKAFDEDMTNHYPIELDTVKKWRLQWQRDEKKSSPR